MAVMSLSVGCKSEESEITAKVTTDKTSVQNQKDSQLTETDFYNFFECYFSLSEQEILSLNKNYPQVNSDYWNNLGNYKQGVLEHIGEYLSDEVKTKLGKQYLNEEIQLPRKLRINEYVTYGSGKLEKVKILSTRLIGEDMVYEVTATTCNPVQSLSAFEKQYEWGVQTGYYDLRKNALTDDLQTGKEVPGEDDYIYACAATEKEKDEIKLMQRYWVTVASGKEMRIKSIQEAQPIKIQGDAGAKVTCNQHVTRMAYRVRPSAEQSLLIEKMFAQMMVSSKEDFKHYVKVLGNGYEAVKAFWEEKGLLSEMILEPASYETAFSETINPYKDDIVDLIYLPQTIQIIPSIYSTKLQMRFIVTLPIKALLSNNEIVYYKYKYFVGMDDDKVEFIEFVNMELLTEENYNASMSDVSTY